MQTLPTFFAKSAVNAKCCLLFVDLFTSKIYTYPMKNISLFKKNEPFYNDISKNRNMNEKMRLQTDQEFQQNEIKKLNSK